MPNDHFSTAPTQPAPFGAGCLQLLMAWQMAAVRGALLAQGQQWEAMGVWQRSAAAVQRELMDEWICRFGGGVPLDG
ncbi:hypothetical protein [Variovorax sp. UMC13]|uniref:hypothetical protein n=1 Tax=Variovorax sp. UMC13 TaxID=1862326 RepID=UPI0016005F9A|nr:hypothetical protein [Variovorax sp. UMC13]MBB1602475.1 hypothetical protein [Variovorax sp. UMC13]